MFMLTNRCIIYMAGRFVRIRIIEDFKDLQDWDDAGASSRHCGLDPQSRGAVSRGGRHTGFKAVSTGRGDNKTTPTIFPLSLDGRGIKGEGEKDKQPSPTIHTQSIPTDASVCYADPTSQNPA